MEKEIFDEESTRKWNSYFYPGTTTLINKFDIRDEKLLFEKETEVCFERLVELYESPIKGDFDKEHLKDIHRYLFSPLYEWAGEYRTVYMKKNRSYFADVGEIDLFLEKELAQMNEEIKRVRYLEEFACFLATYYVILLNIHPFREGNGRAIREFLRQLVLEKTPLLPFGAMELDFTKMDSKKINEALPLARVIRYPIEQEFLHSLTPVNNLEDDETIDRINF